VKFRKNEIASGRTRSDRHFGHRPASLGALQPLPSDRFSSSTPRHYLRRQVRADADRRTQGREFGSCAACGRLVDGTGAQEFCGGKCVLMGIGKEKGKSGDGGKERGGRKDNVPSKTGCARHASRNGGRKRQENRGRHGWENAIKRGGSPINTLSLSKNFLGGRQEFV